MAIYTVKLEDGLGNFSALVEVEAGNEDDAKKIALECAANNGVVWERYDLELDKDHAHVVTYWLGDAEAGEGEVGEDEGP